ncbi:hypothetical protein CFN78_27800 [Amycolatopsis antarctica]|uniref:DUF4267 domain-containing protein n=1 Tax=Amycolatopsis antarctica TaxID=1854586 RepID=A0A263CV14_9PSEU|nr:hypothetical protein [Amycolatopsis antarctica]OZM69954.1 hypothetical protein CFN78_27800 [Amycolatopsis antarctica]
MPISRSIPTSTLTKILGAGTAAYGAAILVRPALMAKPCGLTDARGAVAASTGILIGAIGLRDIASGLAMSFAPDGRSQRTALAVRVASDAADALLLGLTLPDRSLRPKAAAAAGGWGLLCALSGLAGRKR